MQPATLYIMLRRERDLTGTKDRGEGEMREQQGCMRKEDKE